jgi:tripeptide aminopeptidase
MSAAEYLIAHPEIPHPEVECIFTPDEETGAGLPCLPRELLHSKYCYTLDGGGAPEIET